MSQQKSSHERLCILIVEDSDVLREMFRRAFHDMHLVYAASSVKEGWELYLDKSPSIVFLDIGLPDGSGHDLARRIKEKNPATYIVMATASRDVGDKQEAVYSRVDGFITKPFNKQEINDYVDRFMVARRKNLSKK